MVAYPDLMQVDTINISIIFDINKFIIDFIINITITITLSLFPLLVFIVMIIILRSCRVRWTS